MTDLRVTELDFDTIKTNLKTFLKSKPEFTDYNFEGAGLSVLLDALAYNTHYNAINANMIGSEMFLDTAQNRSSIVSRAKELNYLPTSKTASVATLRVTFVPVGSPNPAVISKNTQFNAILNNKNYLFITTEAYNVVPVNDVYTADIDVYQGGYATYNYVVDSLNPNQRFIIPNKDVDTRFLSVKVKDTSVSVTDREYLYSSNVVKDAITSTSEVYYLQETFDGYFEVKFGDDVLGRNPTDGSIITIEYLITAGADANGIQSFTRLSTVAGTTNVSITVLSGSAGGADIEDIESIRTMATKFYQSQNRALTTDDYSVIIKKNYPIIKDAVVWGGEDNLPTPVYGKVFVSLEPNSGYYLNEVTKAQILADIRSSYAVVTVKPEYVAPEYLYINVSSNVNYNSSETIKTVSQLQTLVSSAITTFFADFVDIFNSSVILSKLSSAIDDADTSITGNTTGISLDYRLSPTTNVATRYTVDFANPVKPGLLTSTTFSVSGVSGYYFRDVPTGVAPYSTGVIQIVRSIGGTIEVLDSAAGTIDYTTGYVVLTNFITSGFTGSYITITSTLLPSVTEVNLTSINNEVITNGRNQILKLNNIVANVVAK